MFRRLRVVLFVLGILPVGAGLGSTGSTTQGLTAQINVASGLTVAASAAMTPGASKFAPFQATLPVSYWARTTPTGAGGTVTVRVTSDFAPAGGPSAASGVLTYTCGGQTYGTACSGTQTASTAAQTPLLTLPPSACTGGGGSCSAASPNTVNLNLTLTDNPAYPTGSYSAVITFTISAT
ncbi:MAG: hypothetical protein LAP87_24860 [Acidobacteriia bacterium]|nr:hypothetical protein [Terriglobia bacterium]